MKRAQARLLESVPAMRGANSMGTPVLTFDFSTWTKYAPAFANPSLGQVYFNTATASIIANALVN
jgi:hypothetical protein